MCNNIPNAKVSPRVENGVIKWYEGDTFSLQLELELRDQDGEAITIGENDTVHIIFRDDTLDAVKEFNFTEITGNIVTMVFDSTVTALFPKGRYTYDVHYTGENRTTVCNDNKAEVE